uniref:Uncharacterized protein n=1 Tax=Panagrolaimus sp. JU765 TaxID=591449 RepID=A0AC34R6D3_9BILA
MPTRRDPTEKGDLIINFKVDFPKHLNRDAINKLVKLLKPPKVEIPKDAELKTAIACGDSHFRNRRTHSEDEEVRGGHEIKVQRNQVGPEFIQTTLKTCGRYKNEGETIKNPHKRHADPKEAAPTGRKKAKDERTEKLEHLKASPAFSYPSNIRQYPKQKEEFLEFKGLLLNPRNFLCREFDPKYPIECSLCVNEKFTFLHLFDEKHLKNNQKKYNSEPRAVLLIFCYIFIRLEMEEFKNKRPRNDRT